MCIRDSSKRFILQRINTDTFTDPVGLMENICGVTRHLREKILAAGGDPARELSLIHILKRRTQISYHLISLASRCRSKWFPSVV